MKARKFLTVLSAASALLLVGGCSNSQQSSEKTAKQSGKKQSSEKSSSKKSSSKKTVKKQSSESSSSEASSSSSSSQASQESSSSSASSQSSSSAASSSSSSQTQKYADEEYAAAALIKGVNPDEVFTDASTFYLENSAKNMYFYQTQQGTSWYSLITVNSNDIYMKINVNAGHPNGLDHETISKSELDNIIAQHKQEIDDYISEQGSNQDEDY